MKRFNCGLLSRCFAFATAGLAVLWFANAGVPLEPVARFCRGVLVVALATALLSAVFRGMARASRPPQKRPWWKSDVVFLVGWIAFILLCMRWLSSCGEDCYLKAREMASQQAWHNPYWRKQAFYDMAHAACGAVGILGGLLVLVSGLSEIVTTRMAKKASRFPAGLRV